LFPPPFDPCCCAAAISLLISLPVVAQYVELEFHTF
jgi:hypothetical protein